MRGKDNCDQCTSPNACDQCSDSMYLNSNGDCGTQCPSGYTGIGSGVTGRTCEACEPNCGQCTNSSTCTQCSHSMYLNNNGDCVRTCPNGCTGIGSEVNGVSGYTTGRTCEENAACSTLTCPNTDINKGVNCMRTSHTGSFQEGNPFTVAQHCTDNACPCTPSPLTIPVDTCARLP